MVNFSSGESCLIVDILKSKSKKKGYSINLRVLISHYARDELFIV